MATPGSSLPPVDPNVPLPPSVAKMAANADALHRQAYADPANPQPDPTPAPAPENQPAPQPAPQPETPPPAQQTEPPAPAPQPQPDAVPAAADLTAEQWRHRYLSMEGRYKQAANSIGSLQEQMQEMGDELMRSQSLINQLRDGPQPPRGQAPQPVQGLVTDAERQTYGDELLDVVKRAAREAVMPDLQNLHTGVQRVGQQVQRVSTGNVYADLAREVPDWPAINNSERFKEWCRLRDVYSGQLRGRLLNAALKAADAPRVIAFFKGFLAEEQATGQIADPLHQPPVPPAPRTAAVPLVNLAAPGRAHPAGGNTPVVSDDKPIFTRSQIAQFYSAVRQGAYNGREAEKAAQEQAIFRAQNEGRVR